MEAKVEELITRAAASKTSDEAQRFAQAALNAAHAFQVLETVKRDKR